MDLLTPAQTWTETEPLQHENLPSRRMPFIQSLTMFLSVVGPIAGFVAAIVLMWHRGPASIGWPEVVAMVGTYVPAAYGVTIGFHRLLTHRAFESPRFVRLILAVLGSMAAQGAVIRWTATHRRHHQMADHEGDPHSPHLCGDGAFALLRGMWHAHMGWLFQRDADDTAASVADLMADPMMVLIDKLYFFWVFLGIVIPGIFIGWWTGTWWGVFSGMIWGGLARICLMQHITWSINSVCHVWGSRTFKTADHSVNNWICGVLAFGEGWHNNHHAFPTSARHGLKTWQFDSSWLIIQLMHKVGLAKNLRLPTAAAMEIKQQKAA